MSVVFVMGVCLSVCVCERVCRSVRVWVYACLVRQYAYVRVRVCVCENEGVPACVYPCWCVYVCVNVHADSPTLTHEP